MSELSYQFLKKFDVFVVKDRCDQFAFFIIRSRNADVLLEFPLASALIPSRPSAVAVAASGVPFSADTFQSTGDAIADISEDMAAEQKARLTYDNILRLADDPDVLDPVRYLREREIVHYQRFGDALGVIQDNLDSRNFYAFNPSFD